MRDDLDSIAKAFLDDDSKHAHMKQFLSEFWVDIGPLLSARLEPDESVLLFDVCTVEVVLLTERRLLSLSNNGRAATINFSDVTKVSATSPVTGKPIPQLSVYHTKGLVQYAFYAKDIASAQRFNEVIAARMPEKESQGS